VIHHVSVGSNDLARSRVFYEPLMMLLGLRCLRSDGQSVDYGVSEILFSLERPVDGAPATAGNGVHICFQAGTREQVRSFHALGLENGGRDGGPPGIRASYDDNYYGAFLFDPDGNKIEAVTFSAA
jgi:catechol 2,3-dioxygenase-like lactoylglutathione lyase family enzyme